METEKEFTGVRSLLNFSKLDFQTIITGFYISTVLIGMIFSYAKYRRYNINIFERGDIADFLITPLGDPFIILLTVLNFLILYFMVKLDLSMRKNKPDLYTKIWMGANKKPWFDTFYKLQYLIIIPLYLFMIADGYAIFQKKKLVKAENNIEVLFTDNTNVSGKKIGATNSFQFMLLDSTTVKIIPTSSIKTITKMTRKKKVN